MTLSPLFQKLAAGLTATSVVVGVNLLSGQEASALTLSAFAAGGSVTSAGWTATGISASPLTTPFLNWDVNLDALNNDVTLTVSRGNEPVIISPINIALRYSLTGPTNLGNAAASLDFSSSDRAGNITKQIYSDAGFTNLIGTASVTVVFPDDTTTVDATFPSTFNTIYIQDTLESTVGNLNSFSNGYQAVPEPITMLGAGVAIAFGSAFKRRQTSDK